MGTFRNISRWACNKTSFRKLIGKVAQKCSTRFSSMSRCLNQTYSKYDCIFKCNALGSFKCSLRSETCSNFLLCNSSRPTMAVTRAATLPKAIMYNTPPTSITNDRNDSAFNGRMLPGEEYVCKGSLERIIEVATWYAAAYCNDTLSCKCTYSDVHHSSAPAEHKLCHAHAIQ